MTREKLWMISGVVDVFTRSPATQEIRYPTKCHLYMVARIKIQNVIPAILSNNFQAINPPINSQTPSASPPCVECGAKTVNS